VKQNLSISLLIFALGLNISPFISMEECDISLCSTQMQCLTEKGEENCTVAMTICPVSVFIPLISGPFAKFEPQKYFSTEPVNVLSFNTNLSFSKPNVIIENFSQSDRPTTFLSPLII